MPDSGVAPAALRPAAAPRARRSRWVSPLLRRILLVNAMPLVLLLAALLYLDQYQNGLLEAEVGALRQQARIHAGALAEAAVREEGNEQYVEVAGDLFVDLVPQTTALPALCGLEVKLMEK